MESVAPPVVLVIEDGDEYLEVLQRFVPGFVYRQVHSGPEALTALSTGEADLIYLDMCFDRIDRALLLGDHAAQFQRLGRDAERAWRFLERNQGMFILDALKSARLDDIPILLSHDFSQQPQRWAHLSATYPNLSWISDTVTPGDISTKLKALASNSPRYLNKL